MKIAVIGATGMVGREILSVIEEGSIEFNNLFLVASKKSVGKKVIFNNQEIKIIDINRCLDLNPDLVIFSAGSELSLFWAPKFVKQGAIVIDNSSAWRMDDSKKLIIPEINGHILNNNDKIIANPNCSTIQMLMALNPIHLNYGIEKIIISTYQSVTGTGKKALTQLENEYNNIIGEKAYQHTIHQNVIPHCDDFLPNGYTKEEMKLVNETNKILDDNIKVSATAVRVPVIGGHSESINLTLKKSYKLSDIRSLLKNTPGLILMDNPKKFEYPMPINARGKDEVFVGRIRRDLFEKNGLNLWIVADNLRKGAATNTVQIAEHIIKNNFIH
tara:strand:+ start:4860 stop:5849 length:990 start_codon:yes stop_codon:yes gene_type:complete